jgi:Predicted hydrolases or acyltransferases (alpha/beta hydrolase superfamily)
MEELGKHFTVYAIDLPGHGYSDRPAISYNVEEVALCLEAFMNTVGLVSAHFCTFGESAAYVLDFVQHNQERANNLMFISPLISSAGGRRSTAFPFVSIGTRLLLSRQSFYNDLLSLYFDRTILTPEVLEETFMPFGDKEFKQIIRLYASNYNDREIIEKMLELQNHVLIIRGADDKVSPDLQEGIASFPIRNLKTYTIRNCNYLVQEEKADRAIAAVIEFCNLYKDHK